MLMGLHGRQVHGFTLLEVLVAIALSAGIALGAVQLLSNISGSSRGTEATSDELTQLQRFNQVVSRDMEQFIDRPIRDVYGDSQPSLILDGGDYLLEFTRAGWRNSPVSEDPHATMQRIAYRAEALDEDVCLPARRRLALAKGLDAEEFESDGDCLVRYVWSVLDRSSDSEPRTQIVLDEVFDLRVELIMLTFREDTPIPTQEVVLEWPPIEQLQADNVASRPGAIRWTFSLTKLGEITRLWQIPYAGERF
ncbi:MAG: type II secretion system minor pseudopilin GspJ [Oleibacter sp.]|nr:type II secretion system minor pseudopilin GspJ [Thalassolituus sp.]